MSLLWLLALGAVRADIFEDVVMRLEITGDTELWDALFKGARQLETVVGDDKVTWSEGPLWTNGSLLFTDTITAKLHRYDRPHVGTPRAAASRFPPAIDRSIERRAFVVGIGTRGGRRSRRPC